MRLTRHRVLQLLRNHDSARTSRKSTASTFTGTVSEVNVLSAFKARCGDALIDPWRTGALLNMLLALFAPARLEMADDLVNRDTGRMRVGEQPVG